MADAALPMTARAATETARTTLPVVARNVGLVRGGRRVLDGASLALDGTPFALMGPNGAGKSLLLRALHGLIAPEEGTVTWSGYAPGEDRRRRQGFVFQRPVLLRRSAAANLDFALGLDAKATKGERADRRDALLDRVRLLDLARTPARRLSGGEQQRLALARALALGPELLFLDEPTASLDPASTALIERIVAEETARGTAVLWVTHDRHQAARVARRVAVMARGRVVEEGPVGRVLEAPETKDARAFLAGRIVV